MNPHYHVNAGKCKKDRHGGVLGLWAEFASIYTSYEGSPMTAVFCYHHSMVFSHSIVIKRSCFIELTLQYSLCVHHVLTLFEIKSE
jgi:hypothetical protein